MTSNFQRVASALFAPAPPFEPKTELNLFQRVSGDHRTHIESDIKKFHDQVDKQVKWGCTPLWAAANNGSLASINALLAAGATAGIASDVGVYPLHEAAGLGHNACVERLLAEPWQANTQRSEARVLIALRHLMNSGKKVSHVKLDRAIAGMTGQNISTLNQPESLLVYAAQIADAEGTILGYNINGWYARAYMMQKLRVLISMCLEPSITPDERILLQREAVATLDTFGNIHRLLSVRRGRTNATSPLTESNTKALLTREARMAIGRANQRPHVEHPVWAGYDGHACYAAIRFESGGEKPGYHIWFDNLGAGSQSQHETDDGRVASEHLFIPLDVGGNACEIAEDCLTTIFDCLTNTNETLEPVYATFLRWVREGSAKEIRDAWVQNRQIGPSCVTRSDVPGMRRRLPEDLYAKFKIFERKCVKKLVKRHVDVLKEIKASAHHSIREALHDVLGSEARYREQQLRSFMSDCVTGEYRKDALRNLPWEIVAKTLDDEKTLVAMIRLGLDPAVQDKKGQTLLHVAAQRGYFQLIRTMICEYNTSPNVADKKGFTPLHTAVMAACSESIQLLKSLGANPQQANKEGLSPTKLIDAQQAAISQVHASLVS